MWYIYIKSNRFCSILILHKGLSRLEVGLDHLLNQCVEVNLPLPAQDTFSFCRISKEQAACKDIRFISNKPENGKELTQPPLDGSTWYRP